MATQNPFVTQAPNMTQAIVAPDIAAQQLQLQRQQQLADMLKQQALTPMGGTEYITGSGPTRAVAKSPLEGVAKLLSGYLVGKSQEGIDEKNLAINKAMADRYAQILGGTASDSNASQAALGAGAVSGSVGPTPQNAALMNQMTANQGQPSSPFTMANLLRGQVVGQLGGDQAGAAYWDQYKPTEFQKDLKLVPQDQQSAAVQQKFLPPIIARGSPVLTRDKFGNLQVDPASVEAIRQQENIKTAYDAPVTLNMPNGSTLQLAKPEWADYQKTGNLPLRFLPQDVRQGIQQEANSSGKGGVVNYQTSLGNVSGTINPSGGTGGGLGPIGLSESTAEHSTNAAAGPEIIKKESDLYEKGSTALTKVAQNNKMIELLPEITTGPINKQITMLKNISSSLGVDLGDPAPNQEFEKYAVQGALSAAKQIYGGRLTNQDVTTQIATNPGATMTEKAIYQMLKWDNELQQRHIQAMTQWRADKQRGLDMRDFESRFNSQYPYQGIVAPTPETVKDFRINTPALPTPKRDNRPPLSSIIKGNS